MSKSNEYQSWMQDSALFIDREKVNSIYEAIVRPEFELVQLTQSENSKFTKSVGIEAGAEAEVGATFLEIVKAKLKTSLKVKGEQGGETGKNETSVLKSIVSEERKLEELLGIYELGQESGQDFKILFEQIDSNNSSAKWILDNSKVTNPKPLCFFDVAPKTILIPVAAEFEDGTIELLYETFRKNVTTEDGGPMKTYPELRDDLDSELKENRKRYWSSFAERFSATQAMLCIEDAAKKHGKICWIDFRLPVSKDGDTLHLHISANGKYHTGVFAYNFVKRFYKHGGKIVGMLKSEPDLNVLAIYEN